MAVLTLLLAACAARPSRPALWVPSGSEWVEVAPDVRLRYQRTGSGDSTVILLHELGTSLESWDEELPYLTRSGRTLVRYDQRGAGLSTKIRAPLTMAQAVEDLRALIDRLGLAKPVVLVGDTTGSAIALLFAATYPESTAGVVALDPAVHPTPQPTMLAKFPDPLAPGAAPATLAETAVDRANPDAAHLGRQREFDVVYPAALRTDPERWERFRGIAFSADPTSALLTLRMIYSIGFAEVLPRIQCPVIVTGGTLFLRPMSAYRELSDAMPRGRFVELHTGHYPAIESPQLVGPLVRDFLTELGR